jgi:hypothetical protein
MSRITRNEFVNDAEGEGLDVRSLSDETKAAVERAGLSEAELRDIAGADGIISGKDELGKLFSFIDKADHNRSYKSIDTTEIDQKTGKEVATDSGLLHDAIQRELEKVRLAPPSGAKTEPKAETKPETKTDTKTETPTKPKTEEKVDRPVDDTISEKIATETAPATEGERQLAISTLESKGFTDIHLAENTPYYNQADKNWGRRDYPKNPPEKDKNGNPLERKYKDAGCAPAALAMVDVSLRGSDSTPLDVGKFAVDNDYSGKPGRAGSDAQGLGKAWAKEHNLVYTPANDQSKDEKVRRANNVDTLRDGLKEGGVGVISVGKDYTGKDGHFTEGGHVMVVNGYAVDKDGKEWFFVVNPGRNDQTDSPVLTTDKDVVQDRSLHHGAGQLMISREQLEKEMKYGFVLSKPE